MYVIFKRKHILAVMERLDARYVDMNDLEQWIPAKRLLE